MPKSYQAPATQIARLIDDGLRQSGVVDQSTLAKRCGVTRSYIVKVKNGDVRHLKDDFLQRLATTLQQDPEDYRVAALVDNGQLPRWHKVLEREIGVRLSSDDQQAIRQYARTLVKERRGAG